MFSVESEFAEQIRDRAQSDAYGTDVKLDTLDEIIAYARPRARDFVANEMIGREKIHGLTPSGELTEAYYIMCFIDSLRAARLVDALCNHIEAQQNWLDQQVKLFTEIPGNAELARTLGAQISDSDAVLRALWSLTRDLGYADILRAVITFTDRGRAYAR